MIRGSAAFGSSLPVPVPTFPLLVVPSGALFHWQANLEPILSLGEIVPQLTDQSGNNNHAIAAPTGGYYEPGLLGQISVHIGGDTKYTLGSVLGRPANWTVVAVAIPENGGGSVGFLCGSADASGSPESSWGVIGANYGGYQNIYSVFGDDASSSYFLGAANSLPSGLHIIFAYYNDGEGAINMRLDGAIYSGSSWGSAASSQGSTNDFSIGCLGGITNHRFTGYIIALFIWDRGLTSLERVDLESMLQGAYL